PLDGRRRVEPIDAERALADLRRQRIPLRRDRAERAGQHAVAAADADLGVVDHRPFGVLLQGGHRAGRDAGRVVAVHALPLGEDAPEPCRRVRVVHLVLGDQHVGVGVERGRILEGPEDAAGLELGRGAVEAVPLLADHLAGVAADALGGVDQLGVGGHRRPPGDEAASSDGAWPAGITLTRQALVSFVPAPGAPAAMVSTLTLGPVERPLKPQLYGIQTIGTSWPAMRSDFIRRVTTALTTSSPRAELTRVQSPVLIPSFWPSSTGSSIIGSGASSLSHGMLRVVDPAHQCSAIDEVIRTYGYSFAVPIGCLPFTRGYLRAGLICVFG